MVKRTLGFESWEPNPTPDLGKWFEQQVEVRPLTEEKKTSRPPRITEPNYELTNRTFPLAMDIGMYLSQVIRKSRIDVQWEHGI